MRCVDVLYVFRRGRQGKEGRVARGEEPDDMFYGWNHLRNHGIQGAYLNAGDDLGLLARLLWHPLELVVARLVKMGCRLDWAIRALPDLRQADIVVSTTDSVGLPIAILKRLGLLSTPLLYFSQGLSHRMAAAPAIARALLVPIYGVALQRVEKIVVLGEGAMMPLAHSFGLDPERVSCLQFGVDTRFWNPATRESIPDHYILTVGSDLARDYPTLAAALMPHEHLVVVSRLEFPSKEGRVRQVSRITDVELRELYQQAAFVVTPLQNVDQPSGQSATLQAMACGKAVILSDTQGLWDRAGMCDGHNCLLVPSGDVERLRAAIETLSSDPDLTQKLGDAARKTVLERYDSRQMGTRVAQALRSIVGSRG